MTIKQSFLSILILIVIGLITALPAQAQEEDTGSESISLDTVLAQAAAEGLLTTLVRPDLAGVTDFYRLDSPATADPLAALTGVTAYTVIEAEWLGEGSFQLTAKLQPGGQTVTLTVGRHDNRWLVDGIDLEAAPTSTLLTTTKSVTVNSGPAPVEGNGSGQIVFQTQSGGGIYLIHADGTGLQYITNGLDPQLSPDGSRIAFTRWEPRYELFVINVDGSSERALTHGWRQMKSPTWSADGSKITFSYQDGGRLDSESVRINLAQAAQNGDEVRIPSECVGREVEGKYFKCTLPADAHWKLKQIEVNTLAMTDLATELHSYGPTGHPSDSNLVIYKGERGLALNNAALNRDQPITSDHRDHTPVISPDGSKVAVSYWQHGHWEIHTMRIDGSQRQRLTETPLTVLADNMLLKTEVVAGKERTVAPENPHWNNAAPVWSPDGSQLAFITDRSGQWEIWLMKADGSNQRPMFPNGAVADLQFIYAGVDERMLSWR